MIARKSNPLKTLSDSVLMKRLDMLVQKEREVTLKLLLHLIEVNRRALYLERGYGSLFDYCTLHLGYSEAAANRRIRTARCMNEYPNIYRLLEKNELSLTVVSRIAGIINDMNKDELLAEVKNKSRRQVEAIVARYNPKSLIPDRVKTVYLKAPATKPVTPAGDAQDIIKPPKSDNCAKFTTAGGGEFHPTTSQVAETLEKKFKLEFAVSPEVMAKIEKAKALMSNKLPRGAALEQLLDTLLDEYINKHDPGARQHRRENRKSNKSAASIGKKQATHKRRIPAAVKDQVNTRDNGRCAYVSQDGTKCNSRWHLQIDHIVPYAKGGDHSIDNLRLLCGKHNRLEADKAYGREFMNSKIQRE